MASKKGEGRWFSRVDEVAVILTAFVVCFLMLLAAWVYSLVG